MAGRYNAEPNDYIVLGVSFTQNGTPYDPEILAVEIYDSANNLVTEIPASSVDHPGPTGYFTVTVAGYDPGTYFDRWRIQDFVYGIQYVFAEGFVVKTVEPTEEEPSPTVLTAKVNILNRESLPWAGLLNVPVWVCRTDGTVVAQRNTGAKGFIEFIAPPGEYIVLINDKSTYYKHNVFPIELQESSDSLPVPLMNVFTFATDQFHSAEGTALNQIPPERMCHISGWLVYNTGAPAAGIDVYAEGHVAMQTVGTGLGHDVFVVNNKVKAGTTDASGYVEFDTLRNGELTITVANTGIQRRVLVPDAPTADMVSLIGSGNDILTVTQIPFASLIRAT